MIMKLNAINIEPHARIVDLAVAFPDASDLVVEAVFFNIINLTVTDDRGNV